MLFGLASQLVYPEALYFTGKWGVLVPAWKDHAEDYTCVSSLVPTIPASGGQFYTLPLAQHPSLSSGAIPLSEGLLSLTCWPAVKTTGLTWESWPCPWDMGKAYPA